MERNLILIDSIPTVVWGKESEKIYIYVHGKNGNKEEALFFANIAERKGYQTISFDLPSHGERKNKDIECRGASFESERETGSGASLEVSAKS